MEEQTDAELIGRCLNGHREAYGELVERYQKVVFNLALRIVGHGDDAEDIAQTVFVKAYERLADFNPEHRFFSWIYRMTINESLNYQKRLRVQVPLSAELPFAGKPADQVVYESELERLIDSALAELSHDYRTVILLRHLADLSYCEIAETLAIPEKTVKSRLFTARRLLCDRLMAQGVRHAD